MPRIFKTLLPLAVLVSLSACTVVPPRVDYVGPRVEIIGPTPYYAPPPYYVPAPSYYYYEGRRRHGRPW